MFDRKNLLFCFFFVFSLICSSPVKAGDSAEEGNTYERGRVLHAQDYGERDQSNERLEGEDDRESSDAGSIQPETGNLNLIQYFIPTVARVPVSPPQRSILMAIAAIISAIPSFQAVLPAGMIGLEYLGVTKDVIPDTGPASLALSAGMFVTPFGVGCMAAYEGMINALETPEPEVSEAHKVVTTRSHSKIERFTYSYPTQFIQMAFWEATVFALIMNIESHVTGWGDPRIWGGVFGALALPIVYFLFVRSTNNPGENLFRPYKTEDEKGKKESCLGLIEGAAEAIKHKGFTSAVKELGKKMMVIQESLPSDRGSQSSLQGQPDTLLNNRTEEEEPLVARPSSYQAALQQMDTIKKTFPDDRHSWNKEASQISRGVSLFMQTASLPMKGVVSYVLLDKLFDLCTLSSDMSMGMAMGATALASPFLVASSFKEAQLTYKECEQLLWLYKPQSSCNFLGERIAPWTARAASFVYFTLPLWDYLGDEILESSSLGITNPAVQMGLLLPFTAATVWPASAQVLDRYFTRFSNWIATGGYVGSHKLLRYFDTKNERDNALKTLDRVQEFKEKVIALNSEYTTILCEELRELGLLS